MHGVFVTPRHPLLPLSTGGSACCTLCLPRKQALDELEGGGREPVPAGGAAGRLAFTGTGVDQRAQVRLEGRVCGWSQAPSSAW